MKCGCYILWSKHNPSIRKDYVTPYQIQVFGEPISIMTNIIKIVKIIFSLIF